MEEPTGYIVVNGKELLQLWKIKDPFERYEWRPIKDAKPNDDNKIDGWPVVR